jgi:hypothetical protein
MFIAWFYSDFILMSGLFTPSNMAGSTLTIVTSSGNLLEEYISDHFIIAFYAFIINGFAVLVIKN